MRTIASTLVVNAKVVHMNNNSLTIESVSGERVFIHRRVFNALQENPDRERIYGCEKLMDCNT